MTSWRVLTATRTSATPTSPSENGDFPSWTLQVQITAFRGCKTYRFNPLTWTKVWPHSDYPAARGRQNDLDHNVTDYHAEIEQAAFQPNNVVPGTGLSPDKMLGARASPYPMRIGTDSG